MPSPLAPRRRGAYTRADVARRHHLDHDVGRGGEAATRSELRCSRFFLTGFRLAENG